MFLTSLQFFLHSIKSYQYKGAAGGSEQAQKLTAGVIESSLCNNYKGAAGVRERGRSCRKKISSKKLFAKVSQCRKPTHSTQHYPDTLSKTYPNLIHRGEDPSRLSGPFAYLNT